MTGNQREVGFGLIIGAKMVDLEGIREGELDTAFRQVLERALISPFAALVSCATSSVPARFLTCIAASLASLPHRRMYLL